MKTNYLTEATKELSRMVKELQDALGSGGDFGQLAGQADKISEKADLLAVTLSTIDDTLANHGKGAPGQGAKK